MKGNRKSQHSREAKLILLCGFAIAVFAKADTALFTTFAVSIVGASGAFMWGNAQEHKATPTPEVKA